MPNGWGSAELTGLLQTSTYHCSCDTKGVRIVPRPNDVSAQARLLQQLARRRAGTGRLGERQGNGPRIGASVLRIERDVCENVGEFAFRDSLFDALHHVRWVRKPSCFAEGCAPGSRHAACEMISIGAKSLIIECPRLVKRECPLKVECLIRQQHGEAHPIWLRQIRIGAMALDVENQERRIRDLRP